MSVKLIGGLAALAIALTDCSAIGGAGSAPTWKPTYATSTVATSTVAPTAVRVTPPGIGVPVRNGSLEFTVYGTRTATAVYDQFGGHVASAEGAEYVIVKVSVRNIDTQAVHFFPTMQSVSVRGQQFTAEAMPTAFLNHGTEVIQPGLTITFELAFHLWTGTPPEAILLSDILGSSPSAARVSLVAS